MLTTWTVLRRYLASIPLSLGFAALLVVTALVTGTFFGEPSDPTVQTWAAGVTTTVDAGRWYTILTAPFIPWDPPQLIAGVLLSAGLLGIAERLLGRVRMLVVLVVTGVAGVGLGVLVQWLGSTAGEWWSDGTSADLTMDPLTPIAGALMAATAFMGPLWRRRFRLTVFALLAMFVLYDGDTSSVYKLLAALAGLLIGWAVSPRRGHLTWHRSSFAESRVLIATIVVVTAVGPLITYLHPDSDNLGALSLISSLFGPEVFPSASDLADTCGLSSAEICAQLTAFSALGSVGAVVLTFAPIALLLVAAYGLRRGRRFAWGLALVTNAALAAMGASLAALYFGLFGPLFDGEELSGFDIGDMVILGGSIVLVPVGVIVLLVVTRKRFWNPAPREAVIRFWVSMAVLLVVLGLAYAVSAFLTIDEFTPATSPGELVVDTWRRFLPATALGIVAAIPVPSNPITLVLFQWVGPVFWAAFALGVVRLLRADERHVAVGDHQRIRALLRRGGGGTLGWMTTWPGNVYWFREDGQAAVAYRVINGVAITMSDPVCAPGEEDRTIREFASYCDRHSWIPVFYSVHDDLLPVFTAMGWQHMSVGEETLMHPQTLEMTGKPWQNVRSALNRGTKEGMTTVWTTYDELPRATIAQINAISEAWVSEKELPEMGFTLGALEEIKDPDVKLMLAVDPEGLIHGVTSWLPVYRDGRPIGYTIDFMRRADQSMNGTMEFLIASAALHMKEEGIEVLSLSGAPLAKAPVPKGEEPPAPTVMTELLDFLAKTLEPAYGFSTLFRFKAKFNPTYVGIHMAYPDPLALPTIGTAIGKAYLPSMTTRETVALVRTLAGSGSSSSASK